MTFEFKNMVPADRLIRIGLGLLMLALGWRSEGGWAYASRILALYPLASGLAGWCPLYTLFGYHPGGRPARPRAKNASEE